MAPQSRLQCFAFATEELAEVGGGLAVDHQWETRPSGPG